MNPRRLIALLGLIALALAPRTAVAQTKPEIPALPGSPPAEIKSAPPAEEKKADAKNSDAPAPDASPATPAAAPGSEKSPATPAAAKAKSKSIFTLPTAAAAKTFTPPPLSPRFLQVRTRMDALFASRNDPPAPPDARLNPFRPPGAIPVAPITTKDGVVEPVAVDINLALLQQAVAVIRVKGKFTKNKTLQLVISTGPGKEGTYKEGDVLNVSLAPDPVHLKIRVITQNSVTFTLADAEMVLRF